jgi:hypothetical protein
MEHVKSNALSASHFSQTIFGKTVEETSAYCTTLAFEKSFVSYLLGAALGAAAFTLSFAVPVAQLHTIYLQSKNQGWSVGVPMVFTYGAILAVSSSNAQVVAGTIAQSLGLFPLYSTSRAGMLTLSTPLILLLATKSLYKFLKSPSSKIDAALEPVGPIAKYAIQILTSGIRLRALGAGCEVIQNSWQRGWNCTIFQQLSTS